MRRRCHAICVIKAAWASRPASVSRPRPDAAWVTSAVNDGRIAFVIKLCPTICAALLRSG